MRAKSKPGNVWLILLLILTLPAMAYGGIPEVNHVMVTDVTTVSFSVIWATNEPCTADLEVYEDEDGIIPVSAAVIESHPVESGDTAIADAAQNNGVMKVRVTGLEPSTPYYFRTVTESLLSPDSTAYPNPTDNPPTISVQTEFETVRTYTVGTDVLPFSNDVIIKECYLEDGDTPIPAEGTLLIATVKGGNHPITAFVGDGVPLPYALIDLNNVFSRDFSENLDLQSGENLTLVNFRGIEGYSIITHEVPEDLSLCEVKPPENALAGGRNMVSFPIEPGIPTTEDVLNPIIDNAISVWAFNRDENRWIFFARDGLPFLNELTELHSFQGFWLYLENDESWIIHGNFNTDPISLKAGRNLVGFRSIESIPVLDAIAPIENELISIWHFDVLQGRWIFYVKEGLPFLNELEYIEPGKAYWVYADTDCAW